ncbi:MAG: hypothetical protein ACPG32_14920 [Akkermansiaceae bacterium]
MRDNAKFRAGILFGFFLSSLPLYLFSCGSERPAQAPPPPPQTQPLPFPNPEPQPQPQPQDRLECRDGTPIGGSRKRQCSAGQEGEILEVCSFPGRWEEALNTCKKKRSKCEEDAENKVTWEDDIKPIINRSCISCHSSPIPFNDYESVKGAGFRLAKEMIDRINRDAANADIMPPRPLKAVSKSDKDLFEQWAADGYPENGECNDEDETGNNFLFQDLNTINGEILQDLNSLPAEDQPFTRYALCSHKYNGGDSSEQMKSYGHAIQKALNGFSIDQEIYPSVAIDARKTIWRFDLRNYNLTRSDWDLVLDVEPFDFQDNTSKGKLIQQLTNTAQPWLHADNMIFTAVGDPDVYNTLADIPENVDDLYRRIGVNFDADLLDFDALLMGFNGSPISLNKNRLLSRHESTFGPRNRGYMWQTYDPNEDFLVDKNLFQFPLLVEAGGQANFNFDAGEIIYSLPNGLLGYALYNNVGVRQTEAPVDIVVNNRSPFDAAIKTGIDCARCHARGIIPAQDQVRASVLANASDFENSDVDIVKELYPKASSITATFTEDNRMHRTAIQEMGFDILEDDPMNFFVDRHRDDYSVEDVAAFTFLPVEEFLQELSESNAAKKQVPQLLSGGTITLEQLIQVFPIFIDDFRLGLDPIDE